MKQSSEDLYIIGDNVHRGKKLQHELHRFGLRSLFNEPYLLEIDGAPAFIQGICTSLDES